jgi:hypothetical protein
MQIALKKQFILGITLILSSFGLFTSSLAKDKKKVRYPVKVNNRPLVMPAKITQVSAFINHTSLSISTPLGSIDSSLTGLGFSAIYGVTKGLDVGAAWGGMLLDPSVEVNKSFALRAGYDLLNKGRKKKVHLAAQVSLPLSFEEGADALSALNIGMATRYRVMKRKLAIHTGENLLNIDLTDAGMHSLNIPLGIAYQINKKFNLRGDFQLVSIPLGDGDVVSIADTTPLTLTAFYAMNDQMDVAFSGMSDLQSFGDVLTAMVLFNYRLF